MAQVRDDVRCFCLHVHAPTSALELKSVDLLTTKGQCEIPATEGLESHLVDPCEAHEEKRHFGDASIGCLWGQAQFQCILP